MQAHEWQLAGWGMRDTFFSVSLLMMIFFVLLPWLFGYRQRLEDHFTAVEEWEWLHDHNYLVDGIRIVGITYVAAVDGMVFLIWILNDPLEREATPAFLYHLGFAAWALILVAASITMFVLTRLSRRIT